MPRITGYTFDCAWENRALGLAVKRALPIVNGLLAATALVRGMSLVTRNVRDIGDIGISVVNPWNS